VAENQKQPQPDKAKTKLASDPTIPAAADPEDGHQLTPEEQMARFEKEMKESDWGHQPC
jgi:hypothetical protein